MALSDWTKLNRTVSIQYTKRKYYNKFLYKLSYRVPGVRVISWVKDHSEIDTKLKQWNSRTPWGSYLYDKAEADQIKIFYDLYNEKSQDLKFRIEGQTFNIYSNSEEFLHDLAKTRLKLFTKKIISISLIKSDDIKQLLEQGFTVVKRDPDYTYQIKLKEGFQKINEREGLATYLKNLGSDVKLSTLMFDRLKANTKYFSGGYVYLNDPRLIDMLKLVAPNLIGTVNQMVTQ
jgi:hypothetical protein